MKNKAKKITAIGLGVCVLAVWFVFLLFVTRPYTEKVIIWLPNNYKLENTVQNEVVSILPGSDTEHQSEVFYSQIGMESFRGLLGKSQVVVAVKIQAGYRPSNQWYRIVYQSEFCCEDKSFIVMAQEFYDYNKNILSEMRFNDQTKTLSLDYNRNTIKMSVLLFFGFIVIAGSVYLFGIDMRSKQNND